jgi:hypothetical protein
MSLVVAIGPAGAFGVATEETVESPERVASR